MSDPQLARVLALPPQWGDERLPPRFWDKVVPEPNSGCWIWIGQHMPKSGYGLFRWESKTQLVHRVVFSILVRSIPIGLHIDHLCRTRICCNPSHFEPVTPRENVLRGEAPTAKLARQQFCKNGHPLSGDNIFNDRVYREKRMRVCKICKRAKQRLRRSS